jgi:ankyrin repeat protein
MFIQTAEKGIPLKLKKLIEKGADVNLHNWLGWTALMGASQNGHTDIVMLLIEAGAK